MADAAPPELPCDKANAILFSSLCDQFEKVAELSNKQAKLQLVFSDKLRQSLKVRRAPRVRSAPE